MIKTLAHPNMGGRTGIPGHESIGVENLCLKMRFAAWKGPGLSLQFICPG